MKNPFLLLIFFSFFGVYTQAQITLTADDFPNIGETLFSVDASADANLTIGNAGANQTYDFSSLVPQDTMSLAFVDPAGTAGAAAFPNATLASEVEEGVVYFQETPSEAFLLGLYTDTVSISDGQFIAFPFDPSQKILEFPSTFNTTYTDTWGFSFSLEEPSGFADSVRITTTTVREVLFDGYGTVITPEGSFNGLRERTYSTTSNVTEAYLSGLWTTLNTSERKDTSYIWYAKETRGPLVSIDIENGLVSDVSYAVVETTISVPAAAFTFTDQGDGVVDFQDGSTNDPDSWAWDFGDGNTSTAQNPQHTFTAPGTYNVCLTASNSAGSNTACQDVEIILAPAAAFAFTEQGDGVVDFQDESTNDPDSWAWEFGDGDTSIDPNPQHTFAIPGTYNVCLTASNSAGSSTACQDVEIILTPVAAFTFTDQGAGIVDFQDESTNDPESWSWDFGDGMTSAEQNPQHAFTTSGVFNVCLTVSNSNGSNMICQEVNVMVTGVEYIDHLVSLVLAPNPVKKQLNVQLESDEFDRLTFRLVNSLGQVVLEERLQTNERHSFDLSSLAEGIYYYVLRNQIGQLGNRGSVLKAE